MWGPAVSGSVAPRHALVGYHGWRCLDARVRVKSCSDQPVLTSQNPKTPPRCRRHPRLASRAPVLTAQSPVSEADHVAVRAPCLCPSAPPLLPGHLRCREPLHGERSPRAPPCRLFLWVPLRLSFLLFPTLMQDTAGHQSTHLVGERRRRPSFSTLPVGKKLG
jgi:hypothetical protein